MKRILFFSLSLILTAWMSGYAQDAPRNHSFGSEKYRDILKNYAPPKAPVNPAQKGGDLLYSENFDTPLNGLPDGWYSDGNSDECMWHVDATPSVPGYFSSPYSLNYNNGVDFDCYVEESESGENWGWVASPEFPVGGKSFTVSFMFNLENECLPNDNCDYDETFLGVFDENDNPMFITELTGGPDWTLKSYTIPNTNASQNIHVEFYFNSGDDLFNYYYGPFIDNLEVKTGSAIPVSGFALWIGFALIAAFTVFRLRRQA